MVRQFRALLVRAWDARERHARWVAAAAAAFAMAVGLVKGTRVAGSADSYGYVSQALLWLKGLPIQAEPLAAATPWPLSAWSVSPLGYRPGVEAGVIVPTYPPGLPLVMAAFAGVGGPGAVYWVVPLLGALAVWLTYVLGRRYADATSGAAAALLLAASPVFLYQLVQPMSDVPVTAWWLLSLWGAAAGLPAVAGAGAAVAVLTRPNLAPLAAVMMAAVLTHAYSQHRTPGAALRAAVAFALPLAAAVGFLLWLNARLYGSPFMSGYGAASGLFAFGNVAVNAGRYAQWLLETQTPVVLHRRRGPVRPSRGAARRNGRGVTGPGLVRACRRCRRRGVLPAVLAVRGVVVPALSPSGHSGPVDPHDADPGAMRGGGASRSARPAACRRRGASRVGTTSSRRTSEACSIFSVSRADTWPRARSPPINCRRTPSC